MNNLNKIQNKLNVILYKREKPDILNVANYIIYKSNDLNKPVTCLKLNSVIYLLQIMHMLNKNSYKSLLFNGEFIKNIYTPINKNVYFFNRDNGGREITKQFPMFEYHYIQNTIIERLTDIKIINFNLDNFIKDNKNEVNFINQYLPLLLSFDQWDLVKYLQEESQFKLLSLDDKYSNKNSFKYYKLNNNQFWNKYLH